MTRAQREDMLALCTAAALAAGVLTASADPASGHITEAVVCLTAAVHLGRSGRLSSHWLTALPALCALLGVLQLASGQTAHFRATLDAVCSWSARAAALYLGCSLFTGRRGGLFRQWCSVTSGALALGGILAWYTADGRIYWLFPSGYDAEVMGPFANRDHWASFALLMLPFSLWHALENTDRAWLHAGCSAVLFASVVTCGSRAGSGLAVAEFAALAALSASRGGTLFRTAIVACGALVFACVAGWGLLWSRIMSADLLTIRRDLWSATAEMIAQRPLAGSGLGTWPHVYPAFAPFDPGLFMNHAHCDWLEWAAGGGIPFAAVLLLVAAVSLRIAHDTPWAAGVPAIFLHALVDFPLHKPVLGVLTFTLLGMAAASRPRTQRLVVMPKDAGESLAPPATNKLIPVTSQ